MNQIQTHKSKLEKLNLHYEYDKTWRQIKEETRKKYQ